MKYRREIDGLRAVAVVPVILFHAGFTSFSGGYIGVDIFFVISGYLITTIILTDVQRGKFSLVDFYERRTRRIMPALFFIIFASVPFALLLMSPTQLSEFGRSLLAVLLFASNILFWRETGYFSPAAEENPLLHTWSLAVEEQFYLFFPLLIALAWKLRRASIPWVIAACFFVSFALMQWALWSSKDYTSAAFYLAPTRAWQLLSGALCAIVISRFTPKPNAWIGALGLTLIVVPIFWFDETTSFPSQLSVIPVLGAVLVILFAESGSLAGRLLSMPLFVGIGLISYSAYLWHQPLYAFARIASLEEPPDSLMRLLATTSLVLAWATWRFVEQPFRHRGTTGDFGRSAVFGLTAAAAMVCAVFASAVLFKDGLPGRFENTEYLETTATSPLRRECHSTWRTARAPDAACEYFAGDATVAVLGDSHAVELAYSLGRLLEPHDIAIKHFSLSACRPVLETAPYSDVCARWTARTLDYLEQSDRIKVVVVSYRITSYLNDDGAEQRKQVTRDLVSILNRLSKTKQVILVLQAPELPGHIDKVAIWRNEADGLLPGAKQEDWDAQRHIFDTDILPRLRPNVLFVDPTRAFCDDGSCSAGRDGRAFYFDKHHPSIHGTDLMSAEIRETLFPLLGLAQPAYMVD